MALDQHQEELKQKFLEGRRNTWSDAWECILVNDPVYFESYLKLSSVPKRHNHLTPKIQEFIAITVNAAATHLYVPGIHAHIQAALQCGATKAEILEVIELTSTLGVHACNIGMPILLEVLKENGMRDAPVPFDARQEELKADFTKKRGYWHEFWSEFLELDPDFFEAYLEYSSVPWTKGTLEPKVKEFIYTAFDAAATHLYKPGLKLHMHQAIGYGATKEEIVEILEIATLLSFHSATVAVPILIKELASA